MHNLMEFYPFQAEYIFYQLELFDATEKVSITRAPRGLGYSLLIAPRSCVLLIEEDTSGLIIPF